MISDEIFVGFVLGLLVAAVVVTMWVVVRDERRTADRLSREQLTDRIRDVRDREDAA